MLCSLSHTQYPLRLQLANSGILQNKSSFLDLRIFFQVNPFLVVGSYCSSHQPSSNLPKTTSALQHPTTNMMYADTDMDWSPDFCLACDKQTDGAVYCGEACRLAEYEKANSGSEASSPASARSPISWPQVRPSNNFYLPPAYNFGGYKPQAYSPTASTRPKSSPPVVSSKPALTPSSSQSSLFSMRSTSSASYEPVQLSEEARRELRAYASSFDQSRYQRRQSAH